MKIQLEQLDLLRPWPTFTLREGYYAIRVLVRLGAIPIGQVSARPVRKRSLSPARLKRRIAHSLLGTLSKLVFRELQAGGFATSQQPLDERALLHTCGIADPLRGMLLQAQRRGGLPLPPVTVAICTQDRDDILEACIRNLQQVDYPNFDILIVDSSHDAVPTVEICDRLGVEYVRSHIAGASRARNVALAHARHEWVAFTDDDCRPESNWLQELMRPTQDSSCRAVCGLALPAQLDNAAEITLDARRGSGRGFVDRVFGPEFLGASVLQAQEMGQIGSGSNMLLNRPFIQSIGGFDEEIGDGPHSIGSGGAEPDIFHRIMSRACNVHYTPRAIVHQNRPLTNKLLRKQTRARAAGMAAYHTRSLLRYGDYRSMIELVFHTPRRLLGNLIQAFTGRTTYPFFLTMQEIRGSATAPFHYLRAKTRRLLHNWFAKPQRIGVDHTPGSAPPMPSSPRHRYNSRAA